MRYYEITEGLNLFGLHADPNSLDNFDKKDSIPEVMWEKIITYYVQKMKYETDTEKTFDELVEKLGEHEDVWASDSALNDRYEELLSWINNPVYRREFRRIQAMNGLLGENLKPIKEEVTSLRRAPFENALSIIKQNLDDYGYQGRIGLDDIPAEWAAYRTSSIEPELHRWMAQFQDRKWPYIFDVLWSSEFPYNINYAVGHIRIKKPLDLYALSTKPNNLVGHKQVRLPVEKKVEYYYIAQTRVSNLEDTIIDMKRNGDL